MHWQDWGPNVRSSGKVQVRAGVRIRMRVKGFVWVAFVRYGSGHLVKVVRVRVRGWG